MPLINGIYFAEFTPKQVVNTPTLVFLHGAGGNCLFWPGILRRLRNHRTISIDLPGHGKSHPPGRQSVIHYSQIIESWLAELNLKQTILIGFGLGGNIATQISVNYPHLVQGLVLINTILQKTIPDNMINNLTNPVTAQNSTKKFIQKMLNLRSSNSNHHFYQKSLQEIRPAILAGDLMAQNEKTFTKLANKIKQPICIIENKTGKEQLTSEQNHALNLLTKASLIFSEQNSQLLPIDEPQWTAIQLQSFLHNIKIQHSIQTNSGYYLDFDLNEEGTYAIRTE